MSIRASWIDLLYSAATASRKTRNLLTPVGLLIFGAFTTLFVVAALLVDRLFRLPGVLPKGASLGVGISLLVLGASLTAWSVFHFLKVKGTPVPLNPPTRLVDTGPYRYARNPMLTGVFLILFGIGVVLDSVSLVFLFTPLYVLVNVWELKKIEEPELERRLGGEYLEYRAKTPMFFPGLGRKASYRD